MERKIQTVPTELIGRIDLRNYWFGFEAPKEPKTDPEHGGLLYLVGKRPEPWAEPGERPFYVNNGSRVNIKSPKGKPRELTSPFQIGGDRSGIDITAAWILQRHITEQLGDDELYQLVWKGITTPKDVGVNRPHTPCGILVQIGNEEVEMPIRPIGREYQKLTSLVTPTGEIIPAKMYDQYRDALRQGFNGQLNDWLANTSPRLVHLLTFKDYLGFAQAMPIKKAFE